MVTMFLPMGGGGSERPQREANHSPHLSVLSYKAWSFAASPPIRLHGGPIIQKSPLNYHTATQFIFSHLLSVFVAGKLKTVCEYLPHS
jgi:hypothetical protein